MPATPRHPARLSGRNEPKASREENGDDPGVASTDPARKLGAELGLVTMVLIWGINFSVVKWALEAFEPLGFNSLRHVIASLFMAPVLAARGGLRLPPRAELHRVLFLGFIGVVAYQMLFIYGLDRTRAGNASLMLALVPLFLLIMGRSAAERSTTAWVGAILSICGVALVSGSALRLEGTATLTGDVILVGAAGVWAVYTLGAQPLIDRYGPLLTTAWTLWAGSIGLMIAGIPSVLGQEWEAVGWGAWGGLLFSSIFSIGVSYLLWYRGVQQLGGARTAVFSNLTPVVALLTGAFWLGETLTWASLAGAAMVISGVLLVRARPTAVRLGAR